MNRKATRQSKTNAVRRKSGAGQTRNEQVASLLDLANAAYAAGEVDQARMLYHSVLRLNKKIGDAYNFLGLIEATEEKNDLAAKWFSRALKAEPHRANFHNNHGLALMQLEMRKEAVDSFNACLKCDPNFAPAMVRLAKLECDFGNINSAIKHLERALELIPDNILLYTQVADVYCDIGDYPAADKVLSTAEAKFPGERSILSSRAGVEKHFGHMEAAEEAYRNILKINPDAVNAYTQIASIKKYSDYHDDIKKMELLHSKLSNKKPLNDFDFSKPISIEEPKEKKYLALALAKSFESIKNYDKSFFYYKEANKQRRSEYRYNFQDDVNKFKNLQELFSPSLITRFKSIGYKDKTPIFILGMPRSGTTLMEQVFHAHKDVHGAGELNFINQIVFDRFPDTFDFQRAITRNRVPDKVFKEMGAEYIAKIRDIDSDVRHITDKLPHNFLNVGFIRLALPDAKIIHSYRNPIDNAFAVFKQIFGNDGHPYAQDLVVLGQYHNLYRELMAHWDRVFPGQIFENRYEDMVADLEGQARKMLEFCELEWDPNCLNFHKADRAIHTASLAQVRQPIYKSAVEKWRKYETQLQPLVRVLNKGLPF